MKYTYPKEELYVGDIYRVKVYFDNGDYIALSAEEVVEFTANYYDRLIWNGKDFSRVAESGALKLAVSEVYALKYDRGFVCDSDEFDENRKEYIEKRCISGGIRCVRVYDMGNFSYKVFGNATARQEDGFLIIQFMPIPNFGKADSKDFVVHLNDIDKSLIRELEFDFENTDGFTVYGDEVLDFKLSFDKELATMGGTDFYRGVNGGYIKLKLKKYNDRDLSWNFALFNKGTVKQLTRRLCGKNGMWDHDIAGMYVKYDDADSLMKKKELIAVGDIRTNEEMEALEGKGQHIYFIGGYAKLQCDKTIVITFGHDAQRLLDETV